MRAPVQGFDPNQDVRQRLTRRKAYPDTQFGLFGTARGGPNQRKALP